MGPFALMGIAFGAQLFGSVLSGLKKTEQPRYTENELTAKALREWATNAGGERAARKKVIRTGVSLYQNVLSGSVSPSVPGASTTGFTPVAPETVGSPGDPNERDSQISY